MNRMKSMGLGCLGLLLVTSVWGQDERRDTPAPRVSGQTVVIGGTMTWLEESKVSALRDGVIRQMEFQIGARVSQGTVIGSLYDDLAKLNLAKSEIAAKSVGTLKEAEAQRQLAVAKLARLRRLDPRGKGFVSPEELDEAEANVNLTVAKVKTATEQIDLANADVAVQRQVMEEHKILAPFAGVITQRLRDPGEAVHANEPVVHLGKLDQLLFSGWIPIETSFAIQENSPVEVVPMIEGADLPIERMKFRGKVISVSKEVSELRRTEVRVLAVIENPPNEANPKLELSPGMRVEMTVFLDGAAPSGTRVGSAAPATRPAR
jgi:RND family efflux transporter MFP subunit